jgi:hypothetical protein
VKRLMTNRYGPSLLITVILVAMYLPLILQQNDFRTDDYYLLTLIEEQGVVSPFDGQQYSYYSAFRVLPMLTLYVDHALYGGNPLGYYLFNLAVHIALTVLLYLLFRRIFAVFLRHEGIIIPLLAALALGLHADVFYNVLWISNRTESLLLLFYLGALYSWLRYFIEESRGWYLAGLCSLLLALLSKEQAMHLPLLFLFMGELFVRRSDGRKNRLAVLRAALPLIAITAGFLLLRWMFDPGASFFAEFLSPKKLFSFVGINLIAFHPTVAKPLFMFFVENKMVAAIAGLLLLMVILFLLRRADSRTRWIVLSMLILLVLTAFPRVLYHVFPRINSIQVVVILLMSGIIAIHLHGRRGILVMSLYLAFQIAGMMYEMQIWRDETSNARYAQLLEEEEETGPRQYCLLACYGDHARFTMHFLRYGYFGSDDHIERTPLYLAERYGVAPGPEYRIEESASGLRFISTDPRAVFLLDPDVSPLENIHVSVSEPASDYGYLKADIIWLDIPVDIMYLADRNDRFVRFNE